MLLRQITKKPASRIPLLKRLFWVYFLLLIFEGALRKWILPQFSAPLLLVRDPIALLIIWEAYRTHRWPKQWSAVTGIMSASMIALSVVQMVAGESRWFIELYGLRSYLLPFPVAFIMGHNLDEEDLRKFGVCTLWLLLPLVGLEVAQYLAPPDSILNAGSYKGLEQISYSQGHVRASSTFSFVTGPASYIPMAAAFIFRGLVSETFVKKWLLWVASFAVIVSIPVTGSRTMVILLLAVLACVATAALFGVSQLASSLKLVVALAIVAALAAQLPVFSQASDSLMVRITTASAIEGGAGGTFTSRVAGPEIDAIESAFSQETWYGGGIGYGSNAASMLLNGTPGFLAGEGETDRVIFEFGGPFGLAFMFFRLVLALTLVAKAFSGARSHQPLAWFLVPVLFTGLISVLEQPTDQGFMVIVLGFSLAALTPVKTPAETLSNLRPQIGRVRFRPGNEMSGPRGTQSNPSEIA